MNNDFGDANVIGQAVRRAGPGRGRLRPRRTTRPTSCSSSSAAPGYFRLEFTEDKDAARQRCVDGAAGQRAGHRRHRARDDQPARHRQHRPGRRRTRVAARRGVAARRPARRRVLRRWAEHRGAQHQQHRPRRLGARPDRPDRGGRAGRELGARPAGRERRRACAPWAPPTTGAIAYDQAAHEAGQANGITDRRGRPVAPCDGPGPARAGAHPRRRPATSSPPLRPGSGRPAPTLGSR